ncbi:MAG: T9SS type B sorting domain-containing protein, partial [Gelidibacter sp.]
NSEQFSQLIYVRVQSKDNGDCFGIGPQLQLTVNPLPEFTVRQSEGFCVNGVPIVLEANSNSYSYIWTDSTNQVISTQREVTVSASGIYSVMATSVNGCESVPVEFTVLESGIANLTDSSISIDDLSDTNMITIDTSNLGVGDYEFSLGSIYGPYQDSPVFNHVAAGVYTLFAKDKNGCGTAELDIYVMGFPKYFTPNNDTHHDFWNLKGFEGQFSEQSYINIYDRYGLFLARIQLNELGWDGKYKGKLLPASDYWYMANFLDKLGQVRNFKGHFSLIR